MDGYVPFNLAEFMLSHFSRVDFGGDLFSQWPAGIRFEIGFKQVSRAAQLFRAIFRNSENCILVSQDWPCANHLAQRLAPLFETSGLFKIELSQMPFQSIDVTPFDETPYRLTSARFSPSAINEVQLFQAIANREQTGHPKISSGVYVIDPDAKIVMNMYDDRGLDIIAAELETLRPLFEQFNGWLLDNQRTRIELRFRASRKESMS